MSAPSPAAAVTFRLDDSRTAEDLRIFVARARTLVPDGYIRLQASGRILVLTVLVRSGPGPLGAGTITAMRGVRLAGDAGCDVLAGLDVLAARLARPAGTGPPLLEVPPVTSPVPWAARCPPRAGWSLIGEFEVAQIAALARDGLTELSRLRAQGVPEAQIAGYDRKLWAQEAGREPGRFRAGLALGAYALGFLGSGPVRLLRHGTWQRLATRAGDVLAR